MDRVDDLFLIGLSHRTAPVEVRERYAVQPQDLNACLSGLGGVDELEEVCVLSTCNRTEVLALARSGRDPRSSIRARVFRNAEDEYLYSYSGVQTTIHLFRLAAGLDSLVLGEGEILRQLKQSAECAQMSGASGPMLRAMLKQALGVGKRVRTETSLAEGTLSVARVGVDLARRVFGSFDDCRALLVGAGETGLLAAKTLREENVQKLHFCNRTVERATNAARELGCTGSGLESLPYQLLEADLVITCVDGQSSLLTRDLFDARALSKRDRPMVIVDLSVPRAVEESVTDLDGIIYANLDDLEPVVARNMKRRGEATELSTEILVSELHKFLSLRTYATFTPAIEELQRRAESLRDEVLDEICGSRVEPREVELAHRLTRRLLDASLTQMKDSARRTRSEEALDHAYQRFLEDLT